MRSHKEKWTTRFVRFVQNRGTLIEVCVILVLLICIGILIEIANNRAIPSLEKTDVWTTIWRSLMMWWY